MSLHTFTVTHAHTFDFELRASLEAGSVAWALAQADASLNGRPLPESLTVLHPQVREKYVHAALVALLLLNRDAELYADDRAGQRAFEDFEQFVTDNELDWLDDDHPINRADMLETCIRRCGQKAVQRWRHTLCGTFPGLSNYLTKLHRQRVTDGDPALAKEGR